MRGDQQASVHVPECGGREYASIDFLKCTEAT